MEVERWATAEPLPIVFADVPADPENMNAF
jgi:hypothetical protein